MIAASSLGTELQRIGQVQGRLPGPTVVLLGLLALAAALLPGLRRVTQHVTTIAHEGAHATVASVAGRRISSVTIDHRGNGATRFTPGPRAGAAMAAVAGYLGPSGFGLGAAKLIQLGHVVAVLWLGIAALIALMVPLRKSFGIVTVLGSAVALYLIARYATVGTQVGGAYVIAWFLLLSGVWSIRADRVKPDADRLRELTSVPQGCWERVWLVGSLIALGFGAAMLV
jgi:hypothetical protein